MTLQSNVLIHIFYGTETGTAKEIAEMIYRMAINRHFNSTFIYDLDRFDILSLPNVKYAIFIVSTTKDGDIPSNMIKFWNFLLLKKLSFHSLPNTNFTVFGLGDSSYSKYNYTARRLNNRLLQLGGKQFIPLGLGDDQHNVGYFNGLYPWLNLLFNKLLLLYPLPEGTMINDQIKLEPPIYNIEIDTNININNIINNKSNILYKNKIIYHAKLIENERITENDWKQDVRHIEFDIININHHNQYKPGDIMCIYPKNSIFHVNRFIKRFNINPKKIIKNIILNNTNHIFCTNEDLLNIPLPITVENLLFNYLDITGVPKRFFFEKIALFATNAEEKEKLLELSSIEGADLLNDYCFREKRSYLEIFYDFLSIKFETSIPDKINNNMDDIWLNYILELIPLIKPRQYSISSSSKLFPNKIHLTVAIVEYITPYKRNRTGLCSNYLSNLDPSDNNTINVSYELKSNAFPIKEINHLILIGPGTGIAPLRSIIQEKYYNYKYLHNMDNYNNDTIYLFFGCRHEKKDFLYQNELLNYTNSIENNIKTFNFNLVTAFSQDQNYKIYVQTKIAENAEKLYDLITKKNASIIISGSAKRMPTDVYETIRDFVLRKIGKMNIKDAEKYLKKMIYNKKYIVDAW